MLIHALLLLTLTVTADADAAYMQHHYDAAAALYQTIVEKEPSNALAWYRLGVSDAAIGKRLEASRALERALQLGFDPMSVHYRLAGVAALEGDGRTAIVELRSAYAARPFDPDSLVGDPAFDRVRGSAAFRAFVAEQAKAYHPCRYDSPYRALDFWKGNWDVFGRAGSTVGHSRIESGADGCAILESWTGLYEAPGGSISFFDAVSKHWTQHYVSGRGAVTDYTGVILPDGSVQFVTGPTHPIFRMTFTSLAGGSVRQRFETSSDGGRTWALQNDLIYKAAKNP